MTTRRLATLGGVAALAASAGDLALLYVANARRPELALPEPPDALLWVGAALGVLGIPLYAFGYRAASRLVLARSRAGASLVFAAGATLAGLGAVIHGLTALEIHASLAAGTPSPSPLEGVAASGPLLLGLWALAALGTALASLMFAWLQRGALALLSPLCVTIALALAALPTEALRSFLAPAAPNLAHVVFFAACARRGRES